MNKICSVGVILSGGKGVRAGSDLPKQYHNICGKMIIEYAIDEFKKSVHTDVIIIAAEDCWFEKLESLGCVCVEGGKERNDTVRNVIDYVKNNFPECEKILFHDAARPQITAQYIDECFELLNHHEGVITTAHITDSLGMKGSEPIDRKDYYLIQTPEAFRFDLLEEHFTRESDWTAIAQQLPVQADIYLNYNLAGNIKITYPDDFEYFQLMIERRQQK